MDKVKVTKNIFPEWDTGAPCPKIFADEHVVYLAYYTPHDSVSVIRFEHCFDFKMGMPDENKVMLHPLGTNGLEAYEAHVVEDSSWIAELEERYKVITDFTRAIQRDYQHYVFIFHDRTFECVTSGYSILNSEKKILTEALFDAMEKNLSSWGKLVDHEYENLWSGTVFRFPAMQPFESRVDFMLIDDHSSESGFSLICTTGRKAGSREGWLPKEALASGKVSAISRDWLIENWQEWVYKHTSVSDVLLVQHYE